MSGDDLERFMTAGYSKRQALEVVLGVAVSILPNFAHHFTQCAIDPAFTEHIWSASEADAPAASY